jgi:hypothetical protein
VASQMVFASICLMAIGAGVLRITVPGLGMASQVFRVPKAGITFRTFVSVSFGFVMCDLVMAADRSVSHDMMEVAGSNIRESRLGLAVLIAIAACENWPFDHGCQDVCQVL